MTVTVGIGPVSFGDVMAVARDDAQVVLSEDAAAAIHASRDTIDALANDPTAVYGVSTGFGALATRHIPRESRTQLQRSLIRSHAAGSGPEVEREVIRAMMLLRLSTLASGRTGVRRETAQAYADLLSAGLTPVVHEYGSLGCSGDLAPLAHVALSVMGEGYVRTRTGELQPSAHALADNGLSPVTLAEKESPTSTSPIFETAVPGSASARPRSVISATVWARPPNCSAAQARSAWARTAMP